MILTPKRTRGNYDLFSAYSWHVPGIGGMFSLLFWVLGGTLLGVPVMLICQRLLGEEYATLISYPIMFIPAMIYSKALSLRNSSFDAGYKLNSRNFGPVGGLLSAILAAAAVLALTVIIDPVNAALPDMPEYLEEALSNMTEGTLWINILSACIMAPLFEEWLCRGMVLRGLLNYKSMNPYWAISISALFFAVIHMNLWQGLNAFALGWVFGYVYYRTGSLSLTMLMHFVNNGFSLVLARTMPEETQEMALSEVIGIVPYLCLLALCILFMYFFVKKMQSIPLQSPQGNCDRIPE